VFDNSKDNPANPDPSQPVRWGDQSWEEMMLGFFDILMPPGSAPKKGKTRKPATTGLDIVGMFDSADADHNGGLAEAEVTHDLIKENFALIDQDQDKLLRLGEIMAAVKVMAGKR
jgi:hypothetical protein